MNRFILLVAVAVIGIWLTGLASYAHAQNTLKVTFKKTLSTTRAGLADYSVEWNDPNAANNTGYYFLVSPLQTFKITKRNVGREVQQVTARDCRAAGLNAATKYYIHIAPIHNRLGIQATESFPLF